jgi:hypothetical protein
LILAEDFECDLSSCSFLFQVAREDFVSCFLTSVFSLQVDLIRKMVDAVSFVEMVALVFTRAEVVVAKRIAASVACSSASFPPVLRPS